MDQEKASRNQDVDVFPAFRSLQDHLLDSPDKFRAYVIVTMINEANKFDDGKIMLNHKFPTVVMYHHLQPLEKVLLFAALKNQLSNLNDHILENMSEEQFAEKLSQAYSNLNPYEVNPEYSNQPVNSSQYQHLFDNKFEIEELNLKEETNGQQGES